MNRLKILLFFLVFISSDTYTEQQLNNSNSTTKVDISDLLHAQEIEKNSVERCTINASKSVQNATTAEQSVNVDIISQQRHYKKYAKNIAWATIAYGLHATNEPWNYARTTFIPELIKEQVAENNLNKVFLRKKLTSDIYFEIGTKEITAILYEVANNAYEVANNADEQTFFILKNVLWHGIKMDQEDLNAFLQILIHTSITAACRTLTEMNQQSKLDSFTKNFIYQLGYVMLCKGAHEILQTTGLSEYLEPVLPKGGIAKDSLQRFVYHILIDNPIGTTSDMLIAIRVATSSPNEISDLISQTLFKFTW